MDLGMHPYADTFISADQLGMTEPVLPLECYLCSESGQIQLGYISNDFERYNLYAYSYTSSNSAFSRNHWDNYCKTMATRFGLQDKFIIEVGSNDGYLIQQFKPANKVLGVDPSKAMVEIAASQYGIETVNDFFTSTSSQKIKTDFGPADLIIANNVFNHANDPLDFAKGVHNLLKDGGVFVFAVAVYGAVGMFTWEGQYIRLESLGGQSDDGIKVFVAVAGGGIVGGIKRVYLGEGRPVIEDSGGDGGDVGGKHIDA